MFTLSVPFEVLLQPGPFPPRAKRKAEEDEEAAGPKSKGDSVEKGEEDDANMPNEPTPQLDVGVIAIRRKFIPPVGDTYQDAYVVLHDDVAIDDPQMLMAGLERIADTLSPLVRVPFYDDTITRVKVSPHPNAEPQP